MTARRALLLLGLMLGYILMIGSFVMVSCRHDVIAVALLTAAGVTVVTVLMLTLSDLSKVNMEPLESDTSRRANVETLNDVVNDRSSQA